MVTGFNPANDKIDLANLLQGAYLTSNLSNLSGLISVSTVGTNSVISVVDGGVHDNLALVGCSHLNIPTLLSSDTLILPPH